MMTNLEYFKQVLEHAHNEIMTLLDNDSEMPPVVTELEMAMEYIDELEKPQIVTLDS